MIRYKKIDQNHIFEKLDGVEELFKGFSNQVICVYLFGSMHTGKTTGLSDIDIAILYHDHLKKEEKDKLETRIYVLLSRYFKTDEIDLIDLNGVPLSIQYGVVKHKRILYLSNLQKMVDFENYVITHYLDIKPYIDELNSAFIDSLT